jgi:hypothetical protein
MATLAQPAKKASDFVTNKNVTGGIKMPALSLTKVGVGAAFVSATISGLVAMIGPLNHSNPAVIEGAFHIAGLAIAIGGAVAIVDMIVRGAVTVLKPEDDPAPTDG